MEALCCRGVSRVCLVVTRAFTPVHDELYVHSNERGNGVSTFVEAFTRTSVTNLWHETTNVYARVDRTGISVLCFARVAKPTRGDTFNRGK